jgi:signal transduction histidine kinase
LKGDLRSLGFSQLSNCLHRIETELTESTPLEETLQKTHCLLVEFKTHLSLTAQLNEKISARANRNFNENATQEQNIYNTNGKKTAPTLETLILNMAPVLADAAAALGCVLPQLQFHATHAAKNISLSELQEEKLRDSLIHIFRNAVDHGCGNSQEQTINVTAFESLENFVCLEIEDTGFGLNLERLTSKMADQLKLQRISGNDATVFDVLDPVYSDEEIAETIFEPFATTKESVGEISGRGIGLDAVRAFLQELGGSAHVVFTGPRKNGHRQFKLVLSFPEIQEFRNSEDSQNSEINSGGHAVAA